MKDTGTAERPKPDIASPTPKPRKSSLKGLLIGFILVVGVAAVGFSIWRSLAPTQLPEAGRTYPFEIIEGVIVYTPPSFQRLLRAANTMTEETSPERAAAAVAGDCNGGADFWDVLEGSGSELLRRIRLDQVLEHGNAIAPEDYAARAREIFCDIRCDRKFTPEDLGLRANHPAMTHARRLAGEGASFIEAVWFFLTQISGLRGFAENPELRGVDLDC